MNGSSPGRGYLLLRRGGVLWGIENAAVAGLTRQGGSFCVSLQDAALSADEILCVVDDLRVQPAATLRRFWPGAASGVAGLAVHGEEPLVIVDPRHPPELLWPDEEADRGDGSDER